MHQVYYAAIYTITTIVSLLNFCVLVEVLASWLPFLYQNPTYAKILDIIHIIISPFMKLSRWMLSKISFFNGMMIDISPIIAFFVIRVSAELVLRVFNAVWFTFIYKI